MASIATVKKPVPGLEQFAFRGNAVRLHTVERQDNPRYWSLLQRFGESCPVPVLVNTSFNLFGEPVVCEPREAIRTFYCAGIDALVMGTALVEK